MAASQLRLILDGQRLPRGAVYQPPSKLGPGGPLQVSGALSSSPCCIRAHADPLSDRIAPDDILCL